eukprot:gene1221-11311_t
MTSELSKSLIKKYLENYDISDEELKSLYQKHNKSSNEEMAIKNVKQLCQEIVTLFLELNTKTFNIEYAHHNKHAWDEKYIESLFSNKTKVSFHLFKKWFLKFLDYPCITGYTRTFDKIKVGIDQQGRRTFNEFTILSTIGNGSFGKVRKCFHNYTKHTYAVKMMSKTTLKKVKRKDGTTGYDDVLNEINVLKSLNHGNIIKLYMVINDPNHDMLYLILENANKGIILDVTKNKCLDEYISKKYFQQILNGFEYLHSNKIIHRDIKPENILIDSKDDIKIIDFGTCKKYKKNGMIKDFVGTPAFASPEGCTTGKEYKGTIGDIWAIGVTLYCLIFGKLPFSGSNFIELFDNIKNNEINLTYRNDLSKELLDLIPKILEKDPKKRITIEGIKKHPWLKSDKKSSSIAPAPISKKSSQRLSLKTSLNPFSSSSKNIFSKAMTSSFIITNNENKDKRNSKRNSKRDSKRKSWSFMPQMNFGSSSNFFKDDQNVSNHQNGNNNNNNGMNGSNQKKKKEKNPSKRWSIFSFRFSNNSQQNIEQEEQGGGGGGGGGATEEEKQFKSFLEELLNKMDDGSTSTRETEKNEVGLNDKNGLLFIEEETKKRWSLHAEPRKNSFSDDLILPNNNSRNTSLTTSTILIDDSLKNIQIPPSPEPQNVTKKSGILSKLKHIKKEE